VQLKALGRRKKHFQFTIDLTEAERLIVLDRRLALVLLHSDYDSLAVSG
jgi:hypothetical protein